MPPFITIKKIDGNRVTSNLSQVVSVELIRGGGNPYYAVTDTNGRVHFLDKDPLATEHEMEC